MRYNIKERELEIRNQIAEDGTVCKHCGKRLVKKDGTNYASQCKYHGFNLAYEINVRNAKIDNAE